MDCAVFSFHDQRFAQCRALRDQIFVQGQNVQREREVDGLDEICTHYLFMENDQPVGVARSRLADGKVKIERFGFVPQMRGIGLGAVAFQNILDHCRGAYPDHDIVIGAQAYLQRFYERLGFEAEGEIFMDAGIEHIQMKYRI